MNSEDFYALSLPATAFVCFFAFAWMAYTAKQAPRVSTDPRITASHAIISHVGGVDTVAVSEIDRITDRAVSLRDTTIWAPFVVRLQ